MLIFVSADSGADDQRMLAGATNKRACSDRQRLSQCWQVPHGQALRDIRFAMEIYNLAYYKGNWLTTEISSVDGIVIVRIYDVHYGP